MKDGNDIKDGEDAANSIEDRAGRLSARAQGAIAAAVLGAAIAAMYWPAVARGEFLADDWWFVAHYSLARWLNTFKGDWILGQWGTGAYYRPLVCGSMMLDDKIFGIWRPGGWHAVNLVIHWVNSWLLFAIMRRALGRRWWGAALAGALFFALYPRSPEAVYWISGRTVLLVMTFVLATVLLFIKEEDSKVAQASTPANSKLKRWWRWSYLTTALACLTTETSLTIPLILTAVVIFHSPGSIDVRRRRRISLIDDWKKDGRALRANLIPAARRLAPYYAIIIVYFAWRWAALGGPGGYPEQKAGLLSLRALAIPLSHYVYALMNPARYHVPAELFWPVAGWVVLLGLAVIAARRRMPGGLALGVWWMIVALGPYINLALVDEERGRFIYPAAAGFFLAAAAAGAAAWRWIALQSRPAAAALAAIVIIGMGGLYVKNLRGQVANWDEASRTSRRIIDTVMEKYPAPPKGKPMIFAHVDMDPNRKTSLHAIRGALLYPTPMLPTPFGKIYGAKGTPLESWGWGMIPEGTPPAGSPFVLIDQENEVTIYETGESYSNEWEAKEIEKFWTFHTLGSAKINLVPNDRSYLKVLKPYNDELIGKYPSWPMLEFSAWSDFETTEKRTEYLKQIAQDGVKWYSLNITYQREGPNDYLALSDDQGSRRIIFDVLLNESNTPIDKRIPLGLDFNGIHFYITPIKYGGVVKIYNIELMTTEILN